MLTATTTSHPTQAPAAHAKFPCKLRGLESQARQQGALASLQRHHRRGRQGHRGGQRQGLSHAALLAPRLDVFPWPPRRFPRRRQALADHDSSIGMAEPSWISDAGPHSAGERPGAGAQHPTVCKVDADGAGRARPRRDPPGRSFPGWHRPQPPCSKESAASDAVAADQDQVVPRHL